MNLFEQLKSDMATLVQSLRDEESGQVPEDKVGELFDTFRRGACGAVRFADNRTQGFQTLMSEGFNLVLDLNRPQPEIIDIPTLRLLLDAQQPTRRVMPLTIEELAQLALS